MTASPKNHKIGLLGLVSNYERFFRDQVGHRQEFSFEISNVWVMEAESAGSAHASIDRIIFSQSSNVICLVLVFSVASLKGGDLTWQKGIMEDNLATKAFQALEGTLASFSAVQ